MVISNYWADSYIEKRRSLSDKTRDQKLNIRSFYLGSARLEELAQNKRFLTPTNLSAIPRLFKSSMFPLHVALIQVSPPDDFGWMSLGVSVDITMAAALSADVVIAQVKGLGRLILRKLSEAARENGIAGLEAYMLPDNQSMISLFKTLPYKIETVVGQEMKLSCKLDALESNLKTLGRGNYA